MTREKSQGLPEKERKAEMLKKHKNCLQHTEFTTSKNTIPTAVKNL